MARQRRVTVRRVSDATVVCASCLVADRMLTRMKGLLGRGSIASNTGLLIEGGGVSTIHTFFMRFAVDLVFLDCKARVLRVAPNVEPWRVRRCRKASSVLELLAGEAARRRISAGERLAVEGEPA